MINISLNILLHVSFKPSCLQSLIVFPQGHDPPYQPFTGTETVAF